MSRIPCPCGANDYMSCCGPLHAGAAAETPEALMRSRYSAYVMQRADYLLATWHPQTRPEAIAFDDPASRATRWLGLDVRKHTQSQDQGEVEFVARYRIGGGSAQRLHERSRFERIDGRWYYRDGDLDTR